VGLVVGAEDEVLVIVRYRDLETDVVSASSTLTSSVVFPDSLGVPEMNPSDERLSPENNASGLFKLQVYGGEPPTAVSIKMYGKSFAPAITGDCVTMLSASPTRITAAAI
jgi:hypothetical protein